MVYLREIDTKSKVIGLTLGEKFLIPRPKGCAIIPVHLKIGRDKRSFIPSLVSNISLVGYFRLFYPLLTSNNCLFLI